MIEFLVKINNQLFDMSQLVTKIRFKESLNNGCSTLEFSYIDKDLEIPNGSVIRFNYNSVNLFYGYVFSINRNKVNEIKVTAYDQLRYCKVKDSIVVKDDTVTTLIKKMSSCFNLKVGKLTDTEYKLPTDIVESSTWLDIIYEGLESTKKNTQKKYILRDENGSICLRDLEVLKLDLILGDKSLAYDFNYAKSIDNEFYNYIKISVGENSNSEGKIVTKKDTKSIEKYGLIQYYESIYNSNTSQANAKADNLLKTYNRERETLSLSCIGDIRIRAGSSFFGKIEDIDYNNRLIAKSVSHEFIPTHTMEVEAMLW